MRTLLFSWQRGLLIGFAIIVSAQACQICLPIPTTSAADHLLEAEIVVLAREDPLKPFSLSSVEVLKGDLAGIKIDLFLDSSARRILSLYPSRKVVCTYQPGGRNPGWLRIGIADAVVEPMVREILGHETYWEKSPKDRPRFFGQLLGHENSQISTLAHLEVARAPYDEIKQFADILPVEDLRAFLRNYRLLEWHALYILLLAQSGEELDHQMIEEKVRSAARFSMHLNLAAWATAWIEVKEEMALEFLEQHYLENPQRTPDEMKAVLAALSVHGNNGHVHLRERFVEDYRTLLKHHPAMAPQVVRDLTAWKRWDLAPEVNAILVSPPPSLDLVATIHLRSYLRQGDEKVQTDEPNATSPGYVLILVLLGLLPIGLAVSKTLRRPS